MADNSRRSKPAESADVERMEDEGAATSTTDPAPALADEIVELRKERDGLHDRLLRQAAEFDNYRKRVDRRHAALPQHFHQGAMNDFKPLAIRFGPRR